MYQIEKIPFQHSEFISLSHSQSQKIFVSPKSICELFDISWNSQNSRLLEHSARWNYQTIMLQLPGDDRKRKLGIIPEKKMRSWICSINPEKVKLETREQLIAFQDECDEVLHNYWTKGVAVNPRFTHQLTEKILNKIEKTEDNYQKLALQMSSLAQEFIKMNERLTILENKVDSIMEVRGNFNERHWLFGKFIEVIANEIDLNRLEINKTQQFLQENRRENQQDKNVVSKMKDLFEEQKPNPSSGPISLHPASSEKEPIPSSSTINMKQAEKVKKLVKTKGKTRKEIFEIWNQFKQKFHLKSYYDLPASKFQQALSWLNKLQETV